VPSEFLRESRRRERRDRFLLVACPLRLRCRNEDSNPQPTIAIKQLAKKMTSPFLTLGSGSSVCKEKTDVIKGSSSDRAAKICCGRSRNALESGCLKRRVFGVVALVGFMIKFAPALDVYIKLVI
jgi:hypothetical protein